MVFFHDFKSWPSQSEGSKIFFGANDQTSTRYVSPTQDEIKDGMIAAHPNNVGRLIA